MCVNFTCFTYWLGNLQQVTSSFSGLGSLSPLGSLRQLNELKDKMFDIVPGIRLELNKYYLGFFPPLITRGLVHKSCEWVRSLGWLVIKA